jgi:anti-anti-sigma factor
VVVIASPAAGAGPDADVRRHNDVVFVSLAGDIDAEAVRRLSPQLHAVFVRPPRLLVVDLGAVTFLGSAGVGVLDHLRAFVEGAGGRLRLGRIAPCAHRMLEVSGWVDPIGQTAEVEPA